MVVVSLTTVAVSVLPLLLLDDQEEVIESRMDDMIIIRKQKEFVNTKKIKKR